MCVMQTRSAYGWTDIVVEALDMPLLMDDDTSPVDAIAIDTFRIERSLCWTRVDPKTFHGGMHMRLGMVEAEEACYDRIILFRLETFMNEEGSLFLNPQSSNSSFMLKEFRCIVFPWYCSSVSTLFPLQNQFFREVKIPQVTFRQKAVHLNCSIPPKLTGRLWTKKEALVK